MHISWQIFFAINKSQWSWWIHSSRGRGAVSSDSEKKSTKDNKVSNDNVWVHNWEGYSFRIFPFVLGEKPLNKSIILICRHWFFCFCPFKDWCNALDVCLGFFKIFNSDFSITMTYLMTWNLNIVCLGVAFFF